MHAVIETPTFIKDAAGLLEEARFRIIEHVSTYPIAGTLMSGTGGARKRRVTGRGKGKSGGHRVVTYYAGDDVPVFLLLMFSKGERDNLSRGEKNALRVVLSTIASDYRNGLGANIRRIGRAK